MEQILRKIGKQDRVSLLTGWIVGLVFLFVYLVSINHIIFGVTSFSIVFVDEWLTTTFLQRAAFLWESIGALHLGFVTLFISIPNILVSVLLGLLVGLNVMVSVFSYRMPKVCNIKHKYSGVIAFLPSMFTGLACCAPTFLLALGPLASAGLTVAFIGIRPFLIPVSVLLMCWSLYYMLKKIPESAFEP